MTDPWQNFKRRHAESLREIAQRLPEYPMDTDDLMKDSLFRLYDVYAVYKVLKAKFPTIRDYGIQTEKTWSVDQALYDVIGPNFAKTKNETAQTSVMDRHMMEFFTKRCSDFMKNLRRYQDCGTEKTLSVDQALCGFFDRYFVETKDATTQTDAYQRTIGTQTTEAWIDHSRSPISPKKRPHHSPSPVQEKLPKMQIFRHTQSSTLTRRPNMCWNCGSTDHFYSRCPNPRVDPFCYGCGRRGVTLRLCPVCGPDWKNLGPYHPERGHLGTRKFS
ncbi:uncharacterized protein LOC114946350 [Nylanderia fulva]|uniref:uncharacterized protein LOC114946350 n=1 Tax=Nylanderia fulva TaxID=613905 RepID=UPI0010FB8879|nr:uncharacterized protein LOC114946350 [Nylanderia fulva]XP_029178634.1 uncharacterized protein LOC114946350 [Nylanderia fulva]